MIFEFLVLMGAAAWIAIILGYLFEKIVDLIWRIK
jgi:hypothetical protein